MDTGNLPFVSFQCLARLMLSDEEMPGSWNTSSSDSLEVRAAGIIVPVVFSLIFILGTVGNGLVLAVLLRNDQVKYNTTNLFILNLAMADLCFIICCVPFQATIYTLDGWLFGPFACKAVHFLIYFTMYASSFTLAAVSVDRQVSSLCPHSPCLEASSLNLRDFLNTSHLGHPPCVHPLGLSIIPVLS